MAWLDATADTKARGVGYYCSRPEGCGEPKEAPTNTPGILHSRAKADQFAAVPADIAENGLPSVENCTPWEGLRETHFARLTAQRPAVA